MSRLSSEFERLYRGEAPSGAAAGGRARVLVFGLRRPLTWPALGRVFEGVQAEFAWPAPAVAVSGDGLQLWFSLRVPVERERALALLAALDRRWLGDVVPRRVDVHAHPLDAAPPQVPAPLEGADRWSAFVAPDLGAMFEDTPWLDVEPNEEGQAALLRNLRSIESEEFDAAERQVAEASTALQVPPPARDVAAAPVTTDPRQFLTTVMNDPAVPLALRIEAAKALLR